MILVIYLLLGSANVLMLSLYDIIYAVEPVDAWKPEGNLYESGEISLHYSFFCPQTSYFASKSLALTVSTNQTEAIQRKASAQPVIVGVLDSKSNGMVA